MQIRLVCVGKIRERYVRAALDDFTQRLRTYHTYDEIEVKASKGDDPAGAIRAESAALLERIAPHERVWLLDRTGDIFASEDLADRLAGEELHGRIVFVVGGTYGVDDAMRARADVRWSLSRLTFLHEWSRMIVLEQLYRATKIRRNEPYHH